jgi:hypothetical protein
VRAGLAFETKALVVAAAASIRTIERILVVMIYDRAIGDAAVVLLFVALAE